MAIAYDIQPEHLEPIEFTHFDCWFEDDEDDEDVTPERLSDLANDILDGWEETLSIKIDREGLDFSDEDRAYDSFWIVADNIVQAGYSVYKGDTFIEIYSKADSNTKKYSVIKVVGYAYTVEASSEEEAKTIVEEYGSIEADDIYTDSIDVTLIKEN
jgi:hypothetical protein